MTPDERARSIAESIDLSIELAELDRDISRIRRDIAIAIIEAALPAKGHVIDDEGRVVKAPGTPEFDNQGQLVGFSGEFWTIHMGQPVLCYLSHQLYFYRGVEHERVGLALVPDEDAEDSSDCHTLYPDREAAEAAKDSNGGGS